MNQLRRTLLKSAGTAGVVTAAVATGLLKPGQVLAAEWNKAAFDAKALNDVYKAIGMGAPADSKDILIKAPDIAENGAVVPIEVTSKLAGTESIAIVVDKNPSPLNSTFNMSNGAEGYVSTRIKMGQTSHIRAVVKAGGKSFIASKEVKVTIGGCGG
jgi:sulfur-oxidizing protein SoxY